MFLGPLMNTILIDLVTLKEIKGLSGTKMAFLQAALNLSMRLLKDRREHVRMNPKVFDLQIFTDLNI